MRVARAYYNEFDPFAAQWLRNLISENLIADGDVDERSIIDVRSSDLAEYTQCHFFAGIGGWSYAARLAGWPDERPLWTGSAPCQPFSVAGKQAGQEDERHLWPHFFDLIKHSRPATIMGEQVSAAIRFGWLDGVSSDLEAEGYTTGSIIIPACAVDAPHRRDRLWFVANAQGERRERERLYAGPKLPPCGAAKNNRRDAGDSPLADTDGSRSAPRIPAPHGRCEGDTEIPNHGSNRRPWPWGECDWITGPDGKARRVEPSIRLLAHGVSARVGRLRAYGNAIVPQVAATVIGAFLEQEMAA